MGLFRFLGIALPAFHDPTHREEPLQVLVEAGYAIAEHEHRLRILRLQALILQVGDLRSSQCSQRGRDADLDVSVLRNPIPIERDPHRELEIPERYGLETHDAGCGEHLQAGFEACQRISDASCWTAPSKVLRSPMRNSYSSPIRATSLALISLSSRA